jgi:hypothetical protein
MTTHDEQTNATTASAADPDSPAQPETPSEGTEQETAQPDQAAAEEGSSETMAEPSPMGTGPSTEGTEPSNMGAEPSTADTEPSETETGTSSTGAEQSRSNSLFADDPSGLRSRWDDVQAAFVDDPKECVQKADGLVAEVVEQLTNGFSEARSRLEAQWARGEEASTEDLRQALKR